MVIKTLDCMYTEYKVYPGRGVRFVAKDGKVHFFINRKARSLFLQRIKPVKLTWTTSWRRANKKMKDENLSRRKNRKTAKVQRAIVGLSLEELRRKRAARPADAKKTAEEKVKAHKEKAKKQAEGQKAKKAAGGAAQPKVAKNAPKSAPAKSGKKM